MTDFENSVDQKPVFTPWLYGITTVALRFTTVYYASPPISYAPLMSLRLSSRTPWPLRIIKIALQKLSESYPKQPQQPKPNLRALGQEVGTGDPSESYRGPTESNSTSRVEPRRPKPSH